MIIKTVEELANYLDSDLGWRKKELTFIVSSINSPSKNNTDVHLRIGVVILYAHWEGYIKNAGTYYVLYIKQLGLKYDELRENFIALALKNTFRTCLETKKTSIHTKLVNLLINNLQTVANIPNNGIIDTQSNLRWKVFKEILDTLGLEDSFYSTKDKQINKLVDNRNDVAHGQHVNFDEAEFLILYSEVTNMLNYFREQIIQSASEESFKRNS